MARELGTFGQLMVSPLRTHGVLIGKLIPPLLIGPVIIKGVFLKGLEPGEVMANTLPLALIALITLSAAAWLFRRRME